MGIAALHREIDVGVLLDIVGVQVAVQRGELWTVGIAVIGGVAEDSGVFIQLAPALEVVIAVGIVAAPFAVILVFILLQVIGVVLRLRPPSQNRPTAVALRTVSRCHRFSPRRRYTIGNSGFRRKLPRNSLPRCFPAR